MKHSKLLIAIAFSGLSFSSLLYADDFSSPESCRTTMNNYEQQANKAGDMYGWGQFFMNAASNNEVSPGQYCDNNECYWFYEPGEGVCILAGSPAWSHVSATVMNDIAAFTSGKSYVNEVGTISETCPVGKPLNDASCTVTWDQPF